MTIIDVIAPGILLHPRMLEIILWALLPTIIIEFAVLLFLRERRRRVLLGSVAINCATNIPLTIWSLAVYPTWSAVLIAEVLIVLIETALYRPLCGPWRQALAYAFLANAISFLTGLVVELACIVSGIDMPLLY